MKTKEKTLLRFLSSSDNYDPDKLEYDKQLITQFYNNNGYPEFKFTASIAQLQANTNNFEIILNLSEGNEFNFGKFDVESKLKKIDPEYVKTIYSKENKLEKVFAERNVELKSDQDIARADTAIYSLTENSISLTGNAQLLQGASNIMADQILINIETGLTQLLGSVKTVISPSTN